MCILSMKKKIRIEDCTRRKCTKMSFGHKRAWIADYRLRNEKMDKHDKHGTCLGKTVVIIFLPSSTHFYSSDMTHLRNVFDFNYDKHYLLQNDHCVHHVNSKCIFLRL